MIKSQNMMHISLCLINTGTYLSNFELSNVQLSNLKRNDFDETLLTERIALQIFQLFYVNYTATLQ